MSTLGELTNLKDLLPEHDDRAFYRGDIYYIDLEGVEYASRYVQRKNRPGLIIQNDVGNEHSETIIVALLTRQFKKPYPFQYRTEINGVENVIMFEQIMTLDKFRIMDYVATLTEEQMQGAEQALMHSLGLNRFTLDNIVGFDVESKITKETLAATEIYYTFRFDLACGSPIIMRVPADALHTFDPALSSDSGLKEVRASVDNCRGLHWVVTHKIYAAI